MKDYIYIVSKNDIPVRNPSAPRLLILENGSLGIMDTRGNISAINSNNSNGGGGGIVELTYTEIYDKIQNGQLTAGQYYCITDFQSCYEQPNYDIDGNPIISSGNCKVGEVEPLIVFAISSNQISSEAFSTIYPLDKITYDYSWNETENIGVPAKGRITERIDDHNNRADFDFRGIKFKRYKSYFWDSTLSGRLISCDGSIMTGINTEFTTQLNVGDVIIIKTNGNASMLKITAINSDTEMIVDGNQQLTFSLASGLEYGKAFAQHIGGLYYFNDVGANYISDGGNDMYDGGNTLNTSNYSAIPYTHTQMTGSDEIPRDFNSFIMDGSETDGSSYFGADSKYFTNLYPGLFVMAAYGVNGTTSFATSGGLGADSAGSLVSYTYETTVQDIKWKAYVRIVYGAQDPSVCHAIIVNSTDNLTHNVNTDTDEDDHGISDITENVTQIHYLLFSLAGGELPETSDVQNLINTYLNTIDTSNITTTVANLSSNYLNITDNLPAPEYLCASYKKTNIIGEESIFQEYKMFEGVGAHNNYFASLNTAYYDTAFQDYSETTFLLPNTVFLNLKQKKRRKIESENNKFVTNNNFGVKYQNNTFLSNVLNCNFGNNFKSNYFQYDLDSCNFGNYCNGNYVYCNLYQNNISSVFTTNIIFDSFENNNIKTYCEGNIFHRGLEYNNIEDRFKYNQLYVPFASNVIGSNMSSNHIYLTGGGDGVLNYNNIGSGFYNNSITGVFNGNIISDGFSNNIISEHFLTNHIKIQFHNNTIGSHFTNNDIGISFKGNLIGDNFDSNIVGYQFTANQISGSCQNNKFGDNNWLNNIGSDFKNNTIANYFSSNIIGNNNYKNLIIPSYVSSIIFGDDFHDNIIEGTIFNLDLSADNDFKSNFTTKVFIDKNNNFYKLYFDALEPVKIRLNKFPI